MSSLSRSKPAKSKSARKRKPPSKPPRAHSGTLIKSKEDVIRLIGVSEATLWRMWKRGDFPRPIRLSVGRIGWIESELTKWIEERASERVGA
jgi:prophage regulatory protein